MITVKQALAKIYADATPSERRHAIEILETMEKCGGEGGTMGPCPAGGGGGGGGSGGGGGKGPKVVEHSIGGGPHQFLHDMGHLEGKKVVGNLAGMGIKATASRDGGALVKTHSPEQLRDHMVSKGWTHETTGKDNTHGKPQYGMSKGNTRAVLSHENPNIAKTAVEMSE